CLLLGTAFAITAVAVSVRLLMDVGGLHSRFGKVIVSAAIFDDVFGLVLLAALTAFLRTGNLLSIEGYAILVGKVILFFALAIALGKYAFPMIGRLMRWMREPEAELGILLIAALAYAALAELLGMHFIMGAFMAGLFFGRRTVNRATYQAVRVKLAGITTGFLAPVFFAAIGFQANLAAVREVPVFVVLFVLLAFLGKLAGAGLAARFTGLSTREALCVGAGMSSRGAVELVIADIALKSGLFAKPVPTPLVVSNMYSTIVLMAVVTTLAAPIALRYLLHDHPRGSH
ncbi:MAG: cation:proton antiporter, partial [Pseudomonadota bacterium]